MNVGRRASAASLGHTSYQQEKDAGKSNAVVAAAGKAGSVTSEGDADSKGTTGST